MGPLSPRLAVLVELAVLGFQVFGLTLLVLSGLLRNRRFDRPCRVLFTLALVGLGIASCVCSQFDSSFALFGGATLTGFLIATSWGHVRNDAIDSFSQSLAVDS